MTFKIHGIGTATPRYGIQQIHATEIAKTICCQTDQQRRLLEALHRRAGVEFRHSVVLESPDRQTTGSESDAAGQYSPGVGPIATATTAPRTESVKQTFFEPAEHADDCGPTTAQRMQLYERHAPQLASDAVCLALHDSPYAPGEITHLVTVSCTGFAAPGVDLSLIRTCELNPSVARTHVGFMGCHAAINGLRVSQAYATADTNAVVLLCAVELCTLHFQYGWHPERIVSNSLFADGAAAVVGSASTAHASEAPVVISTASTVIPATEDLMSWYVRDHGFEMSLSAQVPDTIRDTLRPWLCNWLGQHNFTIEDIGSWAVHPGGPRILRACEQALDFEDNQLQESHSVLAEFGNMSSPTVLFILQRLLKHDKSLPCVLLAFGPGLCVEAALVVGP